MKDQGEQRTIECRECGDHFHSEELLKEHFDLEHPEKEYKGPRGQQLDLEGFWKDLKPYLNTSFAAGFTVGVLLTVSIFAANALLAPQSVPVEVTVVTCDNCSYDRFKTRTDIMFNAEYKEVDYRSEKGQELIEKYNIRWVPGFVFEKEVERAANFTQVKRSVVKFEDAYVLSDGEGESARFLSEGKAIR